ncbi:unnamed protein product [Musa acuminata subsp. malaccensis]|uniref:(wild Malaysian banana) hypothetical protein n=1 Tax=Musa acuminata subsp. malaccensis TaxID=214687 RepID=A0A804JXX7_MUSAM|nr:unnamed protein product [Musa acuminata subsp. malaccensis]
MMKILTTMVSTSNYLDNMGITYLQMLLTSLRMSKGASYLP